MMTWIAWGLMAAISVCWVALLVVLALAVIR